MALRYNVEKQYAEFQNDCIRLLHLAGIMSMKAKYVVYILNFAFSISDVGKKRSTKMWVTFQRNCRI
jgi:hypothetical protein